MVKKIIARFKANKILAILCILTIVALLLGIFYITILNKNNKNLIYENSNNYLNYIKNNKFNNLKTFGNAFISGESIVIVDWLLGISLIGIPIVIFILLFKSFLTSFTFISILYNFKLKGILFAGVYIIPLIFNLLILFLLTYYSINFSVMIFNYFFRKKEYNRRVIVKRYSKLLLLSFIAVLIASLMEGFMVPYVLKFIYF